MPQDSSRTQNKPFRLLLSIAGEVFDVSRGARFYGKGGSYEFFAGRDATRAFVTGNFAPEGLTDDIEGLTPAECAGIISWLNFFQTHAKYRFLGYLQGRFYSSEGHPTAQLEALQSCSETHKAGQAARDAIEKDKQCIYQYSRGESRVGCGQLESVPRRAAFMTTTGLQETCVCLVQEEALERRDLMLYKGCDPLASFCVVQE